MTFGSFSKIVGKALLVSLWVGRARSKLLDWNVLNDFAPQAAQELWCGGDRARNGNAIFRFLIQKRGARSALHLIWW
jgi:hypothetical protein